MRLAAALVVLLVAGTSLAGEPLRPLTSWRPRGAGRTRLFGVDRDGRAILWVEGARFSLDEIDGRSGKTVARWEADAQSSSHWTGGEAYIKWQALGGGAADVVRFARLVSRTGPWGSRRGRPMPVVADGETTLLLHGSRAAFADPQGNEGARMVPSDFPPVLAPGGRAVAIRPLAAETPVCVEATTPGAARLCPPGLPSKAWVSTLVWSADGAWLYARTVTPSNCLYAVEPRRAGAQWKQLRCGPYAFAPAPDGKSAILVGTSSVELIALPSGVGLATTSGFPERGMAANDDHVLADGNGRLFAFNDAATALWVIDVKRQKRAHVEAKWLEGLRATRIEKDGTFLLLRATDTDEQLVRVIPSELLPE